jgi:hypothetical protein
VAVKLLSRESCCGMPKLELGDLDTVEKYKNANLPVLIEAVNEGWDLIAPIPSCVLMFKQELPLMFPDDAELQKVKRAFFDPFEYLMHRTSRAAQDRFRARARQDRLGRSPAQQVGISGRKPAVLNLIGMMITIERCSGHDGTYGVKASYEFARKSQAGQAGQTGSAGAFHVGLRHGARIAHGLGDGIEAEHPSAWSQGLWNLRQPRTVMP